MLMLGRIAVETCKPFLQAVLKRFTYSLPFGADRFSTSPPKRVGKRSALAVAVAPLMIGMPSTKHIYT